MIKWSAEGRKEGKKRKWKLSLNFVKRSLHQKQFQLFPLGAVFNFTICFQYQSRSPVHISPGHSLFLKILKTWGHLLCWDSLAFYTNWVRGLEDSSCTSVCLLPSFP